jgi:hypothetical protein
MTCTSALVNVNKNSANKLHSMTTTNMCSKGIALEDVERNAGIPAHL